MGLLTMWLLYTAFGVTIFSLLFVWAVRTRQFSDQERARHLALWSPGSDTAADEAGSGDPALKKRRGCGDIPALQGEDG